MRRRPSTRNSRPLPSRAPPCVKLDPSTKEWLRRGPGWTPYVGPKPVVHRSAGPARERPRSRRDVAQGQTVDDPASRAEEICACRGAERPQRVGAPGEQGRVPGSGRPERWTSKLRPVERSRATRRPSAARSALGRVTPTDPELTQPDPGVPGCPFRILTVTRRRRRAGEGDGRKCPERPCPSRPPRRRR